MALTHRQGNILFAVIMVGTMTLVVTGLNTFVSTGFEIHPFLWLKNWLLAYAVALPVMIVFSPKVRAWVNGRVKK